MNIRYTAFDGVTGTLGGSFTCLGGGGNVGEMCDLDCHLRRSEGCG